MPRPNNIVINLLRVCYLDYSIHRIVLTIIDLRSNETFVQYSLNLSCSHCPKIYRGKSCEVKKRLLIEPSISTAVLTP